MRSDLHRYAAANARVRVLLGTLLGRRGLEALCGYPTTAAVLDALSRTAYGRALSGAHPPERALSRRLIEVAQALLPLLEMPERALIRRYLLHHEVTNLKLVIRCVHRQLSPSEIEPRLVSLAGIATIDPVALAAAGDLHRLADQLRGTAYEHAVRGALHRVDAAGPFAIEVALDLDFYDTLWAAAARLRPSDAACARRVLGILFDIVNLAWIATYRDALGLAPEEILNYTLREGRWLTLPLRRALAEERSGAWSAILARTPYAALLADVSQRGFDLVAVRLWRVLAGEVQRLLTGYPFHIGVPLGFLLAQEIELRDLRVVLTAQHLGMPAGDVLEQLASVRH